MRPYYQIYVEEQLIDLLPDTVIPTTFQAADFLNGDLSSRRASYTNQIKIPPTQNNIRIFNYANNPKSGSDFPFTQKSVKIYCNGIKLLDGIIIVISFDVYINARILSTAKDLSINVANLYLSDLDFGDSPITWNQSFMDTKRASTSGWCSPLIDYGQINDTGPNDSIGDYNLPSIAYKDIITTILSNAGYTISGDFYNNDALFNSMVMTYGRKTWPGTSMKMNDALATDVLQSDVLKDFLIKFGILFRFSGSNAETVTLESILNNRSGAIDWTSKRVKNKKDIVSFQIQNLSKINNYKYDGINNIPEGYASSSYISVPVNGSLNVNNENINFSQDIYTSLFGQPDFILNTVNSTPKRFHFTFFQTGGLQQLVYCMTSNVYSSVPSSFTFDFEPVPKLAYLTGFWGTESTSIKYNGTSRSDFKIGRFSNYHGIGSGSDKLSWHGATNGDGLLDVYYSSFQSLLSSKIILETHEYYLTDIDINSLDLLTPIFDDGNYYLINKVNTYVSGRTTRVELLKI